MLGQPDNLPADLPPGPEDDQLRTSHSPSTAGLPMLGRLLLPEIEEYVRNRQFRPLKETLSELPVVDLAELISDLEASDLVVVFRLLSKDVATEVFEYLEFPEQQALLESLRSETLRHILEEMSADDRTQLLEELPPKAAQRLILMLSPEERQVAQMLLNYPEESVGRFMTPDYIYLKPKMTVEQSLAKIRRIGMNRETVYALYVIDNDRHLLGYVSLRELVTSPLDATVADVMHESAISISATTDQEEAADLFRKYDVIALPVVDRDNKLLGIVTFDDIMDIVEQEHNEDVQLQAAVIPTEESYVTERPWDLVKRRIVWLAALLVAETGGALLLSGYENFLQAQIALALFLPVMIATGGNTGTQSAALVIRAIATGEVSLSDLWPILRREFAISLMLSLPLGLLALPLVSLVAPGQHGIALCVSIGLSSIVVISNMFGTLLPLLFKKVNMDPALMSGPFISTMMDVVGLFIYLQISMAILAD
ncbi:MAG: magnesium transporter [Candidatus Sumerlaeota bacterium]|nr:magnesium transporter [Candidatus Sumerlaeota bacterium]